MIFHETGDEARVDLTIGFKHVLLTWALSVPPISAAALAIISNIIGPIHAGVIEGLAQSVALPVLLIAAVHWIFTGAAAVAASALSLRNVTLAKKKAGWVAVLIAFLSSMYIRSAYQF